MFVVCCLLLGICCDLFVAWCVVFDVRMFAVVGCCLLVVVRCCCSLFVVRCLCLVYCLLFLVCCCLLYVICFVVR